MGRWFRVSWMLAVMAPLCGCEGAVDADGPGGMGGAAAASGSGATSGGATSGGATSGGATSGGSSGSGTGGSGSDACGLPVGSCASPEVRVTEIDVGVTVIANGNEGDTQPIPLAIAAKPSGGSRVAWLSNDGRVYVADLDCDDHLVGTPFSFPANDFQDLAADANGGVVVLTRPTPGGCGPESNLCVPTEEPIPCFDMFMVRYDNAGNEVWASRLTTAGDGAAPYTAGGGSNHFIWWYQHHGRLAYDGTNYAAYFCDAITVNNDSCGADKVDIHEGDRMQVVGPNGGEPLSGHDSFAGGCSHSWNTRIVWDHRSGHFVMVCATDNDNRIARPAPYRTILETPEIGTASVGDLVLASSEGYWLTASYQGTIRLLRFTEDTPVQDIDAGSSDFSHLVSYGATRMLVAWESGQAMTAQVRDSGDGAVVSQPFAIEVPDHRYQAFKAFPDGSVAYAGQGTNDQRIRIARVLPCGG